ncbi:MAG: hypothetical protein K8L99_00695, partial [Anaerolineae bacterium]|nr:hypothetical protein [Anaerolineae bacterium]
MSLANDPPMRLLLGFQQNFPNHTADWVVQVPGREMWVAASLHLQPDFTLLLADSGQRTNFNLRSAKLKTTVLQRPLPLWARYPAGVLLALRDNGLSLNGGMQAALAGEEPVGPRYDYALGMAVAALCYA